MIRMAETVEKTIVRRSESASNPDPGKLLDQVVPRLHQFFVYHLTCAFEGREVRCILREPGSWWAPVKQWVMRPIYDQGRVTGVEVDCRKLRRKDILAMPWGSSTISE